MTNSADYKRAFEVVRKVIHQWDPYGLLEIGAPPHEFDHEIAAIVAQIPHITSEADAANAVSRVFSMAFQPEGFGPSDCAEAGRNLFLALCSSGFLEAGE